MINAAMPPEDVEVLHAVLVRSMEPNERVMLPDHPWVTRARDLHGRGFLRVHDHGDHLVLRATNAGAKALIDLSVIKARDLAGGWRRMLDQLRASRAVHEKGLTDPSLGDLSWCCWADTPHNRAAVGMLVKRGWASARPPEGERETRWCGSSLFVRASDAGMAA